MEEPGAGAEPAVTGEEERSTLFVTLAGRLLAGEADGQPERRAHLLRLLGELMPTVSLDVRRGLVADLLAMPDPPRDLAMLMARDDPEVSGPLLREGVFGAGELCELVMRTGPGHHLEIARRADLTLDVWLALARAATRRAAGEGGFLPAAPARAPAPRDEAAPPPAPPFAAPAGDMRPSPAPPVAAADGGSVASRGTVVRGDRAPDPAMASSDPSPPPDVGRFPGTSPPVRADDRADPAPAIPLEDPGPDAWAFRTDREHRLTALSPAAAQAFGREAPALIGENLPHLLQLYAAAPHVDRIAPLMHAHRAIRDLVVELAAGDGRPSRRWRIRARPRFSFPEGRFLGYEGTARDLDRLAARTRGGSATEILDRMVLAAERLAARVEDPALEDYARSLADLARSLKQAVIGEDACGPVSGRWPSAGLDGENGN